MSEEKINVTDKQVLAALSTVEEPELHKDLVSLNMIKNLSVNGTKVHFTIELTTPACPLKDKIKSDAREAVLRVPGVDLVEIDLSSNVPSDERPRGLFNLPVKNAIAVASGKGGVGKTTVAVNIAVALAKTGALVGLLDADIYGPNVPTMMDVHKLPSPEDGKMIPVENYGVKIMSIGFMVKPGQPLIWRGPMLHSAIRQFLADVAWGELDYLISNLPPGTGDAQLSLAQSLPLSGGVIVTLPQEVSREDAARGLHMFNELNVPIIGVVENMSYLELPDGTVMDVFGRGGGKILADENKVSFLGSVPMEVDVRKSGDEGRPIVISNKNSAAAKSLTEIAEKIAAKLSVQAIAGSPVDSKTGD